MHVDKNTLQLIQAIRQPRTGALGRKKRILGSANGDGRVQMEKSCFNYSETSTPLPDKYSRLNVERRDRRRTTFSLLSHPPLEKRYDRRKLQLFAIVPPSI